MGVGQIANRAVFLDRDGVLNSNVFYAESGEWESPRSPEDFQLEPGAIESLRQLQDWGYRLFLISNQPSYAKGKTSLENLKAVHGKLHSILEANSIVFTDYYYCYHHPRGVVPELSGPCECRKPGTLFLEAARKKYGLDMNSSWLAGDRDTDIICGQRMRLRTIMIRSTSETECGKAGESSADYEADDLAQAVGIIIRNS